MQISLTKTRSHLPPKAHKLVEQLEHVLASLAENTADIYPFREREHSLDFYNKYMDFAVSVYADKFKQLYSVLALALESEWYLVYAQCARAIIEHTAYCRYFSVNKNCQELKRAFEANELTDAQTNRALEDLDRFVRGTRFSWDAFVEKRFAELNKQPHQPHLKQIHINDCLRDWYQEKPNLEHLYDLLCDLVHPNFGSTLMIVRSMDREVVAGGSGGSYLCSFIVTPTLACVVGAYNEIQLSFQRLCHLRLVPKSNGSSSN